ncbi:MAG: ADP-ribosylation factor-like protein [Promethearchaeota archaeon]
MSINDKLEKRKILVLGLEKSGKTSIIFNFIGKFNLSDYNSIKNTQNPSSIKLEKDNIIFSIWDFNGKEIYRNEFLQHFNEYIIDTKEIFYVIDIQDLKGYELTCKFLEQIIKKVEKLNIKIEFTIFLHKYDHDLFDRVPEINLEKIDSLIERIKQLFPSEAFHEIYKTTIYTILDKIHLY